LTWEVRTTGLAINGGAYIDLIPGTSVDYSQQNASQLSKADLACLLASVTLTSVTGGFTAGMVGNLIQIRAGGVNFVAGFYEIVSFNTANSVNLDRTPVAAGNGTGGLGEVGGALISTETFILNGVDGNLCYVKSGTYNFAASRTYANTNTKMFGYDIARNQRPIGNNRPLFQLGTFAITTTLGTNLENIRFVGSGTTLVTINANQMFFFNCRFENTNNAGIRQCIIAAGGAAATSPKNSHIVDCEFVGTLGADSRGFGRTGSLAYTAVYFSFCFFHDLTYGYLNTVSTESGYFFKCIFARIGTTSIEFSVATASNQPVAILFCSFYQAGSYHVNIQTKASNLIYGNTFDGAAISALIDGSVPDNKSWWINNNDFWNNGAPVIGCVLDVNNIGLNPLWVNPAINDFNFGPGSPNIDQALGIRLGV
jgi:hypothetical protein